jgi:glutamate formiminotransferase / 5-formyltetrahydrofolate cyclo-ligase
VRAMGLWLESRGRTQVSMNLVDFRRTSLVAAFERVRKEAALRGARVMETELVGLLPEEAAAAAVREALGMPGFNPERVLERRLGEPAR